jgi:hypothetical protein
MAARWTRLKLIDSENNGFYLESLRKPLMLIALWAGWCPVCISEYGQIAALQNAVGPDAMDVLMVSHPSWWGDDVRMASQRAMHFRLATAAPSNGAEAIQAALTDDGDYFVPRSLVFRHQADGLALVTARRGRLHLADGRMLSLLQGALSAAAPGRVADGGPA